MQDNLNKQVLGALQKLMMSGKNSELIQKDPVVAATAQRQNAYSLRVSQSYTPNSTNGRANFSRIFAIVSTKFHLARQAMRSGNERQAAAFIAAGMRMQRVTHNEVMADDYFVTKMARHTFSAHFETSKDFRDLVLEKALAQDEAVKDPAMKDEVIAYYTKQLDEWKIGVIKKARAVVSHPKCGMLLGLSNGMWGLPGGAIEAGEQSYQAALREITEETGIVESDISKMAMLGINEVFGAKIYGVQIREEVDCAKVSPAQDKDHEFSELKWFQPNELSSNTYPDAAEHIGWMAAHVTDTKK
jgi:8-oxo-dGTP pyrophosphatase MutT (NUDIX family)